MPAGEGDALLSQLSSSEDSGDDYDPSIEVEAPAANGTISSAPGALAGFVEDEEDEDVDGDAQSKQNGALAEEQDKAAVSSGEAVALAASVKSSSQAPSASLPNASVPSDASVQDIVTSSGESSAALASASGPIDDSAQGKTSADPASDLSNPPPPPSATVAATSKAPLPHDVVGLLEYRIKLDPQGDIDAWLGLLAHRRLKQRYDEARKVYSRFFQTFPTAADQWLSYAQMEQELDDLQRLEQIFREALPKVHSVPLWTMYLDHVRRRHPLVDNSTTGRKVLTDTYKFVIEGIGNAPDAGQIWQEYIAFAKTAEGNIAGSGWQDKQKADALRPIFHAALSVPTQSVQTIWKDYGEFESTVHKINARKYMTERSPSYVTARHTFAQILKIVETTKRGATPSLPPLPGFAGEDAYSTQLKSWRDWIDFEKSDPLVLKDEGNHELYRKRVLYTYKHALEPLRFSPDLWFEAAQFCFDNEMNEQGNALLTNGCEANPESALLAFARGDRIERAGATEEGEAGAKKLGDSVRAPFDNTLNALYALIKKNTEQETDEVAKIEKEFASMTPESGANSPVPEEDKATHEQNQEEPEDENDDGAVKPLSRKAQKESRVKQIKESNAVHHHQISMVITHVWIALMRAMRRVQGKGKPGEAMGGMRQIFLNEARKRGRILSDFWVAGALMEHHCYQDQAALRIFERGLRVFPEDEQFVLEYVKHLIHTGDVTNARAVFETTVAKITSNPNSTNLEKAKTLYHFFHDFESKYGELAQIRSLETRMAQLFPEDTHLTLFAERFHSPQVHKAVFDPTKVKLLLSPSQIKPIALPVAETAMQSVDDVPVTITAPIGYTQSPKRPLEDSDAEQPVRKLLRGESPLKGAAGRRQQQLLARQQQAAAGGPLSMPYAAPTATPSGPRPLPQAIYDLLSVMPPAKQWNETRFDPQKMVDLIRGVDLSRAKVP